MGMTSTIQEGESNAQQWVEHLRTIRISKKIPLSKISEMTGIDRTLLARYEAGDRVIKLSHFIQYAFAIDNYMLVHDDLRAYLNKSLK